MKQLPDRIATVQVDSVGEKTATRYIGTFKVKSILTNSEEASIERFYKEELPNDAGVSEELRIKTATIAELRVRIVDGPPWWSGSREGRDMIEVQPLYDLMIKCSENAKDWLEKVNTIAEKKDDSTTTHSS